MNYLSLIIAFWDKVINDPLKTSSIAVWFALVQRNNKHNWIKQFTVDYDLIMGQVGISKNTYYDCIQELVSKNYITYEKSYNRSLLGKITIICLYQKLGNEHDTSCDSTCDASCDSISTLNKHKNNKINKHSNSEFDFFWNLYDKKVSRPECIIIWSTLHTEDREAIKNYLPGYIKSTPNKKYRKDPITFLTKRTWEDEIVKGPITNINDSSAYIRGKKPAGAVDHSKINTYD